MITWQIKVSNNEAFKRSVIQFLTRLFKTSDSFSNFN